MKLARTILVPAAAGLLLLGGLAACDREGPMERAGEQVDKAAERAGEQAERAAERAERKVD